MQWIGVIAFISSCVLLVKSIISAAKKTGKGRVFLIFGILSFVVFVVAINSDNSSRSAVANLPPISADYTIFNQNYIAMTDIQKDAYWKSVKGRTVQWRGTVVEVKKSLVDVRVLDTTFTYDFEAIVAGGQTGKLVNINNGDEIIIRGTLDVREGLFPWTLDNAVILK